MYFWENLFGVKGLSACFMLKFYSHEKFDDPPLHFTSRARATRWKGGEGVHFARVKVFTFVGVNLFIGQVCRIISGLAKCRYFIKNVLRFGK